jgi:hypothetical protein
VVHDQLFDAIGVMPVRRRRAPALYVADLHSPVARAGGDARLAFDYGEWREGGA